MSLSLRHIRRLCSCVTSATTIPATSAELSSISIAKAKAMLRFEYDPDKALQIYHSVSNHNASPISSRYAREVTVRRLAKARRFADIEALIESHKSDPQISQERFFSTLIRTYGIAGMFDQAFRIYNEMDKLGTPRSALSFNALLFACNQSQLFDKVPGLFYDVPERYGFLPDKISYGALVKSYCEAGSTEKAMEVLGEMEEKGIEVTAVTATTLLCALYNSGRVEEAEKFWGEIVQKGRSIDVPAYNVKIMHAHGGKPEDVMSLIREMVDSGLKPNTISYNYLMTCYFKNGMMDEAREVYEGLVGKGCKANAATFRILVYYLCKNEDFERGYQGFEESVKWHKIPDFGTLKILVEGLAREGRIKDAKGLIRTVKMKFPAGFLNAWRKVEQELSITADPANDDSAASDEVKEAGSAEMAVKTELPVKTCGVT